MAGGRTPRPRGGGGGRSAAYGEDDGFVVELTRERPGWPNGVQVASTGRRHRVRDPRRRGVGPDTAAGRHSPVLRRSPRPEPASSAPWRPVIRRSRPCRRPAHRPRRRAHAGGRRSRGCRRHRRGNWPGALRQAWVGALIGGDLRRRTTRLSATLLELAAGGMGPEPLQAWLAGDARRSRGSRRSALDRAGDRPGAAIALSHVTAQRVRCSLVIDN